MGGLVGGIFDLASGDPTQRQENALNSLYSYENPLGENSLNQGLGFYSDVLSGDPTKIAQALAPEIKAGGEQVQQQAEQNSMFGNRGGGTNASTQAAQSGERGNIINLIGGLQSGAAGSLTGAGENLLNMGSGNINSSADLALKNRQRQVGDVSGIAQSAAELAMGFGGGAAAGGMDPGMFSGLMQSGAVQPGSLDVPTDLLSPSAISPT